MAESTQVTPINTSNRCRTLRPTPSRTRYTPYIKSARTHTLRKNLIIKTAEESDHIDSSDQTTAEEAASHRELIDKTWRVYRMSPLYQFSYNISDLKQYSRLLGAHVQAACTRYTGVAVDEESADTARISIRKGLAPGERDSNAILIELMKKTMQGRVRSLKTVLTAVMCCVDGDKDILQSAPAEFTILPVLLVRGPISLSNHLNNWLQCHFGCHVSPAAFSSIVLGRMLAMWSGFTTESRMKPVQLQFEVPNDVSGLSRICIDVNASDCQKLWTSIQSEQEDEMKQENVVRFIKALEEHVGHHFGVYLYAMPLTRIGTAIAYVGSEGRMKVFSTRHVLQVLGYLTEVLLERNLL